MSEAEAQQLLRQRLLIELLKRHLCLLEMKKMRLSKPLPFKRSAMDIEKNKFNFDYMMHRPFEFYRMTRMTVPVWVEYFANPLRNNLQPRTGIITLYLQYIYIECSLLFIGNVLRSCKLSTFDRILRFSAYLVKGTIHLHCKFNVIIFIGVEEVISQDSQQSLSTISREMKFWSELCVKVLYDEWVHPMVLLY